MERLEHGQRLKMIRCCLKYHQRSTLNHRTLCDVVIGVKPLNFEFSSPSANP